MSSDDETVQELELELKDLKKKRGTLKCKLTLFRKYLSSLDSNSITAEQVIDLQMRTEAITSVYKTFDTVQGRIELLCSDIEEQEKERETFESSYYKHVAQAKCRIQPTKSPVDTAVAHNSHEACDSIKLPEIPLPTFNGDFKQWLEFKETFDALIHQSTLKPIQKYKYLRSCLQDGALEVVTSLEYSPDNYATAWKLLCERYNNPRLLVSNHVKALFDIQPIPESSKAVRSMIDNISRHLRALRSLKVAVGEWDLVIIHFMITKLPSQLQKKWEESVNSREVPSLQEFRNFLRFRADLLETMEAKQQPDSEAVTSKKSLVTTTSHNNKPTTSRYTVGCPQCKGKHYINQCPKFLALDAVSRLHAAKGFRLCTNCLSPTHAVMNCRAALCKHCRGKHHSLLHFERTTPNTIHTTTQPTTLLNSHSVETCELTRSRTNDVPHTIKAAQPSAVKYSPTYASTHTNAVASKLVCNKVIILSTATVYITDKANNRHILRVLLDSGSQSNFITQRAFNLLNIPKHKIDMEVIGFNDNSSNINYYCELNLQSKNKCYSTRLTCLIVPNICNLPKYPLNIESLHIPQHLELADEHFHLAGEIDMLIGVELFYEIMCIGRHNLGSGLPILQRTKLGWIVAGAYTPNLVSPTLSQVRCNFTLTSQLQKFWEIEECTGDRLTESYNELSDDETECERIFKTHRRSADGNFIVHLPLKASASLLGHSKEVAFHKFKALERKFTRDEKYKQMYTDFMRDFVRKGRMIKLDSNSTNFCNYLPHHAVVNLHKISTPLRVVFNASMPTSTGVSLNDIQHKGTIRQDSLIDILLRFRIHKYVINADIEKMFCNIFLSEEQQYLQCILWRDESHHKLHSYALTTLSFGLKSAPYIATRCLLQLSQETQNLLKMQSTVSPVSSEAAAAIASDFYLDDLITGGETTDHVIKIALEIDRILKQANFTLRKWKSNSRIIQNTICNNTNNSQPQNYSQIPNTQIGDDSHKILGLEWSSQTDNLMYSLKCHEVINTVTKRNILSRISSIFDPLGLLGPVLITAKCFIQKLWQDKAQWDQKVPNELLLQWEQFYMGLQSLHTLQIPRHVIIHDCKKIELHGFADSSLIAFGAAIYVRSMNSAGQFQSRLLMAKSRVAPLKKKTIPRLELCAAQLLAENMDKVKNTLSCQIYDIKYWSDSSIALAWIKTDSYKLNTFVANRVIKIQTISDLNSWHWVSSSDNPADMLSRGVSADKLISTDLWWQGPSWLRKPDQDWPQPATKNLIQTIPELKQTNKHKPTNKTICQSTHTQSRHSTVQYLFSKYSHLIKLTRIYAYIKRYIHNCKNKFTRITGQLTPTEIINSMESLAKYSQKDAFPIEYELIKNNQELPKGCKLTNLKPFYKNGLIRVGGRISLSNYDFDKKHPIILHSDHTFTKLIMNDEHRRLFHAGPQLLLSSIRERFWPIKGKHLANKTVRECVKCFRANPSTTQPIMGSLPSSRVNPSPPFYVTGLDYAGPFLLRDRRGRGYITYKCYIGVFICFATKAIHFELITGLHTEAFLAAFRRFVARRGKPKEMVSDNGTTFKGACNDLKELYDFFENYSADLTTSCANQGIEWKFIPAYTPHMAGLAEAAVKSCKYHLKRVLGQSLLTYEEFSTVLIQIEAILNSRPLCPLPCSDTDIIQVLTPAHFLIGRTTIALPDYDYDKVPVNRLNYFQQLQQIQQGFWKRWSRDYIGLLQQRTKWRSAKGPSLSEGTIVILKDERLPPCQWSLARIVKTHPGHDGVARVATMKTSKGLVKRAFNNICPLPILDN